MKNLGLQHNTKVRYLGVQIGHVFVREAFVGPMREAYRRARRVATTALSIPEKISVLKTRVLPTLRYTVCAYVADKSVVFARDNVYNVLFCFHSWGITPHQMSQYRDQGGYSVPMPQTCRSTNVPSILSRLLLMSISKAMTSGLLDIQHGALQGRNTTTLATKLLSDPPTQDGDIALLDVAKAFPSVPRPMLTGIVKEAGAPGNIIRMLGEIYQHTPAVLSLHGRDLPIRPTRGMKEGCPLSPTLFLLYYDILLRETKERCPDAC